MQVVDSRLVDQQRGKLWDQPTMTSVFGKMGHSLATLHGDKHLGPYGD